MDQPRFNNFEHTIIVQLFILVIITQLNITNFRISMMFDFQQGWKLIDLDHLPVGIDILIERLHYHAKFHFCMQLKSRMNLMFLFILQSLMVAFPWNGSILISDEKF